MYVKMQLIQFPRTCAMSERRRDGERERERRFIFCRLQIQLLLLKPGVKRSLGNGFVSRWASNLFMRSIIPTVLVVTSRLLERDPSASGSCGAALFLDSLMPSSIRLYDWGDRAAQSSFLLRVVTSIRERFRCALQDVSYHVFS